MKNYYQILGIDQYSTMQQIKEAHRKLSKKFHPDNNPNDKFAEEQFKRFQEAYEILSNPGKRQQLNSELNEFQNYLAQKKVETGKNKFKQGERINIVTFDLSFADLLNHNYIIFHKALDNDNGVHNWLNCTKDSYLIVVSNNVSRGY